MTTHVRAGQVWQHKNSGRREEVVRESSFGYSWFVRPEGSENGDEGTIPEWILTDDYVLVKDAP